MLPTIEFAPEYGEADGKSCMINCIDVITDNGAYREVVIGVEGSDNFILWYDEPIFKGDATIEIALQKLALALGARVSCWKTERDERTGNEDDQTGQHSSDA